jgi:hypothetical protein
MTYRVLSDRNVSSSMPAITISRSMRRTVNA